MKKSKPFEILIIVVLAIVLAGYLTLTYVIKPVLAETDSVNETITAKEAEIIKTYFTVSSYESGVKRLGELSDYLAPYADGFYSKELEPDFLEHISTAMSKKDISLNTLTASEGQLKVSSVYSNDDAASRMIATFSKDSKLKTIPAASESAFPDTYAAMRSDSGRLASDIRTTTLTVEVTGKYNSVMEYLKEVTAGGKNVICSSMSLDMPENVSLKAGDNTTVRLVTTLIFMRIPEISSICNIPSPSPLAEYTFPEDIVDGSYRSAFNFSAALKGLLAK